MRPDKILESGVRGVDGSLRAEFARYGMIVAGFDVLHPHGQRYDRHSDPEQTHDGGTHGPVSEIGEHRAEDRNHDSDRPCPVEPTWTSTSQQCCADDWDDQERKDGQHPGYFHGTSDHQAERGIEEKIPFLDRQSTSTRLLRI